MVAPPDCVYDIVTILYEYVIAVRPALGKPFFPVPSLHLSLSPAHYNSRLRVVATKHGLNPDRVHSHSVRIGGATVLTAAQVPDYVIMAMGGWASALYLQYVRPSVQLYAAAKAALANAGYITAQSIRAMHSHHLPQPSYDWIISPNLPSTPSNRRYIFRHSETIAYCVDKWSKEIPSVLFEVVLSCY